MWFIPFYGFWLMAKAADDLWEVPSVVTWFLAMLCQAVYLTGVIAAFYYGLGG